MIPGRCPKPGETLDVDGRRSDIRQIDKHSITEVAVAPTSRHSVESEDTP